MNEGVAGVEFKGQAGVGGCCMCESPLCSYSRQDFLIVLSLQKCQNVLWRSRSPSPGAYISHTKSERQPMPRLSYF